MSTAPVSQLSWISSYLDLLPGLYNEFNDISRVKFLDKGSCQFIALHSAGYILQPSARLVS